MKIVLRALLIILVGAPGCDLLNGDDVVEGPPALLRNGSFELWQGTFPSYWSHTPSILVCDSVSDAPPGGGQRSVFIDYAPTIQQQGLYQSVVVPDSANSVHLSFWAEGPHGAVYFRVKTPTSISVSDTLVNFYQMAGWYQYSTRLAGSVRTGDSITVILSGRGMYDNVSLTLGD